MNLYRNCAAKMKRRVVHNDDIAKKYKENMGLSTTVISNPKNFSSDEKADMGNQSFVTCGRIEAEKGYDDLIEAFGRFHKMISDWKLLIIGGGSLQKKLEELADKCGVGSVVTFTGYTDQVKEFLMKGAIFMMTSRWEGFPMTITEALEMGLPVIGYGIPALDPLVTDGVEGIIVPAFEQDKLVQAMQELAGDQKKREQMARNAIEKAKQLCPESIVKYWLKLLLEVEIDEK